MPSPLRSKCGTVGRAAPRRANLVRLEHAVLVLVQHVARHLRDASVHLAQHVLLRHEMRRVREHAGAFRVIEVAVAVDDVPDRPSREALAELGFEPGGERLADRVAQDDARRRHVEHRRPALVVRAIEVAAHVGDAPHGVRRQPPRARSRRNRRGLAERDAAGQDSDREADENSATAA